MLELSSDNRVSVYKLIALLSERNHTARTAFTNFRNLY